MTYKSNIYFSGNVESSRGRRWDGRIGMQQLMEDISTNHHRGNNDIVYELKGLIGDENTGLEIPFEYRGGFKKLKEAAKEYTNKLLRESVSDV